MEQIFSAVGIRPLENDKYPAEWWDKYDCRRLFVCDKWPERYIWFERGYIEFSHSIPLVDIVDLIRAIIITNNSDINQFDQLLANGYTLDKDILKRRLHKNDEVRLEKEIEWSGIKMRRVVYFDFEKEGKHSVYIADEKRNTTSNCLNMIETDPNDVRFYLMMQCIEYKKRCDELEEHIKYMPGGDEYQAAKKRFEKQAEKQ